MQAFKIVSLLFTFILYVGWADSVAAIFISSSIIRDGVKRSRDSMSDLMEEIPKRYDNETIHPLVHGLIALVRSQEWVQDAYVRMREHRLVFFGEIFVIPRSEDKLL